MVCNISCFVNQISCFTLKFNFRSTAFLAFSTLFNSAIPCGVIGRSMQYDRTDQQYNSKIEILFSWQTQVKKSALNP